MTEAVCGGGRRKQMRPGARAGQTGAAFRYTKHSTEKPVSNLPIVTRPKIWLHPDESAASLQSPKCCGFSLSKSARNSRRVIKSKETPAMNRRRFLWQSGLMAAAPFVGAAGRLTAAQAPAGTGKGADRLRKGADSPRGLQPLDGGKIGNTPAMKITDIKTFLVGAGGRNWVYVKILTDQGMYRHRRGVLGRTGRSDGQSHRGLQALAGRQGPAERAVSLRS